MTKIGIMTYVRERNVGAALQAYALQIFMKRFLPENVTIETIDYSFVPYIIRKRPVFLTRVVNNMKLIKGKLTNSEHFNGFRRFVSGNITLSGKRYTRKNIARAANEYDAIIVGSDQVWNGEIANRSLRDFLLSFCGKNILRFSYAASFGYKITFDIYKEMILPELKLFSDISLREPIGSQEVMAYTGIEPKINLDPTLLLGKEDYEVFCEDSQIPKQKYIFLYTVMKHNMLIEFVKRLQLETGLSIIYSTAYKDSEFISLENAINVKAMHPVQFITLIKNAEYICTTSFHGAAFAVVFQKLFFTEINCKDGFNYRVDNLLTKIRLGNRVIDNGIVDFGSEIDYMSTEIILDNQRRNSSEYLMSVIDKTKNVTRRNDDR